jgi:uncharacterized membrane protein
VIWLAIAAVAFVGSHFLLSHPLRQPLVQSIGEGPFRGVYSLISLIAFAAMIWAYRGLGRQAPLWTPGDIVWIIASLLMWFASILFVGSFIRNPALPGARGPSGAPRGAFTITRHPMNWSFAIWAIVHAAVVATPKAFILDGAILFLAVVGSALQDRKKAAQMGEQWREWQAHTAFVPFARGLGHPGAVALVGGTIFFFAVTWLHPIPAGFWRWIS